MSKRTYHQQRVSIHSGKWRRRILRVATPDIRPTGDRVRETLFNWLTPYLEDARCLDLFAGSGILGVESVSRGALHAHLIDQNPLALTMIAEQVKLLDPLAFTLSQGSFPQALPLLDKPFDVVFLDPPFEKNLEQNLLHWLTSESVIHSDSWVYLEHNVSTTVDFSNWDVRRSKKYGKVVFHLIKPL